MNVLIFTMDDLLGVARFPKALQQAGFQVSALCPRNSFISKTRFVEQVFWLKNTQQNPFFIRSVVADLVHAMSKVSAQLIIPGDERAVYVLHFIVNAAKQRDIYGMPQEILAVIKSSLGDPAYFEATNNKNFTQQLARELGVKTPEQLVVNDHSEALDFAARIGYPVVLKKGVGFAAQGVKICADPQELSRYLQMPLFAKPSPLKQVIRRLLGRDTSWIPNSAALAVQQFISGTPAVYTFVAMEGKILAGFAGIKEGISPTGQTTRLQRLDHAEIEAASTTLIEKFNYTGFADLEFIINPHSGVPYLLECNPRPTPVAAFGKHLGVDLCQALMAYFTAAPYITSPLQGQSVTLFPQEWFRDPRSPYLTNGDLDVPWDDPGLMQAYFNPS